MSKAKKTRKRTRTVKSKRPDPELFVLWDEWSENCDKAREQIKELQHSIRRNERSMELANRELYRMGYDIVPVGHAWPLKWKCVKRKDK